ncbi:hypothetical protein SeLEV6574_g04920 [Synchytrium endobioticum]|nr:hypothetical protein SeLEV6574_g04920 [Synchytrium endobioticum]
MKLIDDYQLCVKAGPNEKELQIASVNDELEPLFIDSEHFTGYILVRMVNFTGTTRTPSASRSECKPPIENPASSYFKGRSRRYSIVVQGRFKHTWNGDDIVFGGEMQAPMAKVPMGASLVIKAAKWLDPGIECDPYTDKPYMFSPLLCAMNAMSVSCDGEAKPSLPEASGSANTSTSHNIGPSKSASLFSKLSSKIRSNSSTSIATTSPVVPSVTPASETPITATPPPPSPTQTTTLGPFQYASTMIQEECTPLFRSIEAPCIPTYEKRKKHFLNPQKRAEVEFTPNEVYAMDFYDAYVDVNSANVKLPGVSLSFWKYWQGIPLNFIARTRDGKATFFVVQLSMVPKVEAAESNRNNKNDAAHEEDGVEEDDGNTVSEVSSSS